MLEPYRTEVLLKPGLIDSQGLIALLLKVSSMRGYTGRSKGMRAALLLSAIFSIAMAEWEESVVVKGEAPALLFSRHRSCPVQGISAPEVDHWAFTMDVRFPHADNPHQPSVSLALNPFNSTISKEFLEHIIISVAHCSGYAERGHAVLEETFALHGPAPVHLWNPFALSKATLQEHPGLEVFIHSSHNGCKLK